MKTEKELRFELKHLIRELKSEIKENTEHQDIAVDRGDFSKAMHLQSVNGALDYVVGWLNKIAKKA